jgi:hypothetical protein
VANALLRSVSLLASIKRQRSLAPGVTPLKGRLGETFRPLMTCLQGHHRTIQTRETGVKGGVASGTGVAIVEQRQSSRHPKYV